MSESITPIDTALDEFKASMSWSHEATDYQKSIVLGNLSGFATFLKRRLALYFQPTGDGIKQAALTVIRSRRDTEATDRLGLVYVDADALNALRQAITGDEQPT